jgi:5-formyltetrahydrofolate cyclo-ligase
VYVAVPRLASERPFLELDPARLAAAGVTPRQAASIAGSATHGRAVTPDRLPHLSLVICGSVAVNPAGVRVGKGGGYSDLELAVARELGAVDERTVVVTTVHPVQVLDEELPETDHDVRVDLVVTPTEVLRCPGNVARRPPGILADHLDAELAAEIPLLRGRAAST